MAHNWKKRNKEALALLKSVTRKRFLFLTPAFLFSRSREGAQEGYVRKEGMVDAPGIFFSSLEIFCIIPGHRTNSTVLRKVGWQRGKFSPFILFLQIQLQDNLLKF